MSAADRSFRQSSVPRPSALDYSNAQNLKETYLLQPIGFSGSAINNSKVTIREIIQPSVRHEQPMVQNFPSQQSPSPDKNISTLGLTPEKKKRYLVWDELIKDQIESGRRSLEAQKNEERLRKQLYK